VRAVYLYSGMADIARLTGDEELMSACEQLWNNITTKQMYITGGIGASAYGEAFTYDYDLPNDTVYAETCASIGLAFFANRMLCHQPDNRYGDVIEKTLYNGIMSGMSLDGTKFFYVNPLEVIPEASEKDQLHRHVRVERQKWFGCACCPPNLARIMSSLGQYAYGQTENELYVHLFISGSYHAKVNGNDITLSVQTEYPWKNKIAFQLRFDQKSHEDSTFAFAVRVPGWCKKASFTVDGKEFSPDIKNGYAYLKRNWCNEDVVTMEMDMPVAVVSANPKVRENIGKVAVMRGPFVYCLEEADNGDQLHQIYVDANAKFTTEYDSSLLGGIVKLTCNGYTVSEDGWNEDALYQAEQELIFKEKSLTWVPYYAWANRTPGEMLVWVRRR
ncbi:MAG TPA: beta-L-arabinofuranosidase domain-containing protein, partial [Mobilitalea sp.]|nr:beta-L-arabinofuranosidase domain-containing protein [Mobilitalea sp.]